MRNPVAYFTFLRALKCPAYNGASAVPYPRCLTKMELHAWYLDIHRRLGLTTLLITHSIEEALALSDHIYILKNRPGEVVADLQLTWSDSEDKELQKLRYKQEILRILGV